MLFENITFSNNTANKADGGAINFHARLFNSTFNSLVFIDNRAANGGGAINTDNNVNDYNSYANSSFINNVANKGGALNGYGYSNYNSFESCEFRNNSAINSGGAIYYARNIEKNTFKYCVFADNSAKANGGAIYSHRNSNKTRYTNVVFANNTAANNGGAIYNRGYSDSEVYLNTVFINNSATSVDGGCINVYANMAGVTFDNVTFENNRAAGNGGAINVDDDAKYVIFNDTRFINNTAKKGGALAFDNSKRNLWQNTTFINNTAVVSGSAINVFRTTIEDRIDDSYFINNRADGALIDLTNVTDSNFEAIFINNTGESILLMDYVNDTNICNNLFLDNDVKSTVIINLGNNVKINSNIFLNNATAQEILGKGVNADNNWFGYNTTNYKIRPNMSDDIDYDTWLFLNATANPSRITVFDSSEIVFLLYAYNSTSNETCEFDLMNNVYLTITVTGGDVDTNSADLGEPIGFIPVSSGNANATAAIGNAQYTIGIVIDKVATELTSDGLVTVYGADSYLVITLKDIQGNPIAGANITVDLNGVKNKTTDANGQVNLSTKGLNANIYDVAITFAGDENYTASNATATVNITQAAVDLSASFVVNVLDDGFAVNITVYTNPSINGNLTIKFNGNEYPVEVINGTAGFISSKVYSKNYPTDIIYAGCENYKNSTSSVDVLVKATKVSRVNTFTYYYYNNDMGKDSEKGISQIKVVDIDGNPIKSAVVTITIMNKYKLKVRTDANGIAKFTKAYKPGTYSVTATYDNKVTSLGSLVLKSVVNVPKVTTVKKSAKSTNLKIILKGTGPIKGKKVQVSFMKKNYKVTTDKNGVAIFKVTQDMVSKLAAGKTYTVRVTYRMDSVAQSIKIAN